ncbi:MAG: biotin--[acetyl-CoA-carboxylase] ligase [Candidatus Aeolococcus gillhamiae]|uniref:biotin--[biotin carboxyl-carrier protein] ligase n=1 Tax=Candidatus Aeolococcus gillhamiae TaxID=3127015 RepID=A0A2W5Z4R7_9BACT|nr:MAG: biotin--[acetyl-CoA-carboxylase] ligase [Candidatus Dormibacter sp. RRmetagenome_bin12]
MIEDAVSVAALEGSGRKAFPGFRLRALAATTSTQDVVRAAIRAGAAPGFCCTAAFQSSGRGRQQRLWTAPPGSALLASVFVRVRHPRLGGVSIAAGLALRAAIESTSGWASRLKWPNDLLVGDRKLAGVLCEVEPAVAADGTAVVIGMGVNLTVPSFPVGVAGISLNELVDTPPSPYALLAATVGELAQRLGTLESTGMNGLRGEWMAHAAGIGSVVTATSAAGLVSGVAEGIDDDGALLLRGDAGQVRVLAGDVHIVAGDWES